MAKAGKAPEPTLVYVLMFPNPFDKANQKEFEKNIDVKDAQEKFYRIFKTSKKDKENKEVVFQDCLEKISWLKDFSDPQENEQGIYKREFIKDVLSSVLYVLREKLCLICTLLISRDRDEIFLKIYASEEWVKTVAEHHNYLLQFRQKYGSEELKKNKFKKNPPYGPYTLLNKKDLKNQNLFKRYDENGKELIDNNHDSHFLYSDKSRLVIQEIDKVFDLSSLQNFGVMLGDYCVHQPIPLKYLQFTWARIGKIFTDQPLDEIRTYYSEKIAFYFAWIGTYCQFMFFAAVLGLIVEISFLFLDEDSSVKSGFVIFFAVFLMFWASAFDQFWGREEKLLAWKWGTLGFEEIENQRAEFKGVYKRDEVTGKMKVIEKGGIGRIFRVIFSYSFILVLIVCVIAAVWSVLALRAIMLNSGGDELYLKMIPGLLNAFQIKIMNMIYGKVANVLNDWENHETENLYNDHLALKLFLFKFVNSYSSLLYISFFSNEKLCKNNCLEHLSLQLTMIILTNLVMNAVELGMPYFKIKRKIRAEEKKIEKALETDKTLRAFMYQVEQESKLEVYESPLDDYMEMVIQFGYVALFGASLPLVATLAFIEILLEIRVDAWKLSNLTRRPNPNRASDIGVWRSIIVTVAYAGVFTNSGIIFFTMNVMHDHYLNIYGFLILEHAIIFGMYLINVFIPDVPEIVKDGKIWGDRVVKEKLLKGIVEEKKKAECSTSKGNEPFWLAVEDFSY
jgi:hypothetical protein